MATEITKYIDNAGKEHNTKAEVDAADAKLANQAPLPPDERGDLLGNYHRRLVDGKAAEKAHLDDLDLSSVDAGERVQRRRVVGNHQTHGSKLRK